jgi:hypothetical protein
MPQHTQLVLWIQALKGMTVRRIIDELEYSCEVNYIVQSTVIIETSMSAMSSYSGRGVGPPHPQFANTIMSGE